uniref:Helitron helicase-like domain-containing protein n=1 Tax=Aegilops tauschii subsp. strangulata TaxID=200361 RepID=A0A453A415_AEGTS
VHCTISEEDNDEDVEMEDVDDDDDTTSISNVPDPYDMVYSKLPTNTHKLKSVEDCKHCYAKKFERESMGFCCRKGKIKLANPNTPPELMRLWTSADSDSRHFRDNIRFFNGHFSFTSLYCHLDSDTTNISKHPIYTFRAHGQMYHNIRSFGKQDGLDRSHLELYFYDDDPSLEHRYRSCRKEQCQKDKEVITQLVNILHGNPYSEHLRSMGHVDDVDDYHITLNLDQRMDQRRYNTPTTSEVAAVWVEGSERRRQFENSVILQGKNRDIYGIKSYHGCYDALSYPLFFPRGELGWHTDIPKEGVPYETVMAHRFSILYAAFGGRLCVSVRDYYCYKLQMRPGIFNPILFGKRLFQQFAVDTYIKIENSRLDYIWGHQDKIRADLYQGLVDSLHAGEGRADSVGKRTVLATSFIGGPRDMRRRYMDAMALVRRYGKPDIFLTMTCNPNWDEIRQELYPGQTPQDRPDLVVRVFRAKLEELKNKLLKKDILGKVRAYGRYKLTCPEQYDRLISAELPNKKKYLELYKLVVKHMMHGPCGALNPECSCTKGRPSCKNHYPRPFNAATLQGKDSYPLYRRREDGCKAMVRKEWLDNRWVVPYNPHLLRYFNCHINVEACGSIKAVKYMFKYI